jgi:hypothetical protein
VRYFLAPNFDASVRTEIDIQSPATHRIWQHSSQGIAKSHAT